MPEVGSKNTPYHPANVSHARRERPSKMQTEPQGHNEEVRHPADVKAQEDGSNVNDKTNSQQNTEQRNQ